MLRAWCPTRYTGQAKTRYKKIVKTLFLQRVGTKAIPSSPMSKRQRLFATEASKICDNCAAHWRQILPAGGVNTKIPDQPRHTHTDAVHALNRTIGKFGISRYLHTAPYVALGKHVCSLNSEPFAAQREAPMHASGEWHSGSAPSICT